MRAMVAACVARALVVRSRSEARLFGSKLSDFSVSQLANRKLVISLNATVQYATKP